MFNSVRSLIETFLDDYLPKTNKLSSIVRYSVLPLGKCLRGYLVIKTSEMFGLAQKKSLIIASAIELIHAYSLVHDDLPALDNDDMRRGRKSCHKEFGEANAILAGNYILMLAFKIIGENFPSGIVRATEFVNEMIEGQAHDLILHDNDTIDHMIGTYKMKAGALFSMAASFGVRLVYSNLEIISSLEEYGYKIGIAFQMADDLSDRTKIIDRAQSELLIKEIINEANNALDILDIKKDFFLQFSDYILSLV